MHDVSSLQPQPVIARLDDFDRGSGSWLERACFNHRPWVIAICLVLTVLLGWQASRLRLSASFERMIPAGHPYIVHYLQHKDTLKGLGNAVRIAVALPDKPNDAKDGGNIFQRDYLETLRQVNDEVFLIPGVDRAYMKSLWTPATRWTTVTEEGLDGGTVIPDGYDGGAESLREVRANVERSGQIGQLVAADLRSSIVYVPLLDRDPRTGEALDYAALSARLEALRTRYQAQGVQLHITGFAKITGDLIDGLAEVVQYFGLALLITAVAVFGYTRDVRSTVLVVLSSLVAVVWQLGLLPLLGLRLDPYSMLVPFLVFAIGMSHGAQKMNGIMQDIGRGTHRLVAARYTFRRLFLAGLTALLADAVGFAVLLVIDIPVIQDLALAASLGVAVLVFTNLILLPVLLSYTGVSAAAAERSLRAEAPSSRRRPTAVRNVEARRRKGPYGSASQPMQREATPHADSAGGLDGGHVSHASFVIPAHAGIHADHELTELNPFVLQAKLAVEVDPGARRGDGGRGGRLDALRPHSTGASLTMDIPDTSGRGPGSTATTSVAEGSLPSWTPSSAGVTEDGAVGQHRLWVTLTRFTQRRWATAAIAVSVVLGVLGFLASLHLKVGDLDPGAPELRADSRYNRDSAYLVKHYAASADLFVVMAEMPAGRCVDYNVLTRIDDLAVQLQGLPGVEATTSAAALAKLSSMGYNEGNLKWYELVPNRGALGTLLTNAPRELLPESCNVVPLYVYLRDHKADTLDGVVQAVQRFQAAQATRATQGDDAAPTFLLAAGSAGIEAATNIVVKRAWHQMLALVYAAVTLLCFLTFRSWRAVLVAMLPLLLTSLLAEALMVALGMGVKVATLPVIALGVGIGVDYALYILAVTLSRLRQGQTLVQAYHGALLFTGKVVMLTGVTLALGVATWTLSDIKFQADMGLLLAFMFLWNMLGALVLLPALAHWLLRPQATPVDAPTSDAAALPAALQPAAHP